VLDILSRSDLVCDKENMPRAALKGEWVSRQSSINKGRPWTTSPVLASRHCLAGRPCFESADHPAHKYSGVMKSYRSSELFVERHPIIAGNVSTAGTRSCSVAGRSEREA